ncbi:MAG: MBL fold metallo-hydrolase [Anaerolineae bacterium]
MGLGPRWLWGMVTAVALAPLVACAPAVPAAAPMPATVALAAPAPSPTATVTATARPTATAVPPDATFTVVYDNESFVQTLRTDWGFACWVETRAGTVLFDTGGDGALLLANLSTLGLDPLAVDAVVLSHEHADHTGGLEALLQAGARPAVYAPAAFSTTWKEGVAARTRLVELTGPAEVLPGIHTSGVLGDDIPEQALAVETAEGLVVITGCAHPGADALVRATQKAAGGEVALLLGGMHLYEAGDAQIENLIEELRRLGVHSVAPSHCTGERARQALARAYGEWCLLSGVGRRLSAEAP